MLSYQPCFEGLWTVEDSEAYMDYLAFRSDLPESLHLIIVVIHGTVSVCARNAGFNPRSKTRVLPLSIDDIGALDMSPDARERAPKVVDAATVQKDLGYAKIDDLAELMPLSVGDPAVLWDLDILIGSYVHMPLSRSSYRIVASAKSSKGAVV